MSEATIHRGAGVRKAAILVASLDPAVADVMLRQLTPDQAQYVREIAASLDEIDPDEQQRIVDEFLRVGPMVPEQDPPGIELDAPWVEQQISLHAQNAVASNHAGRPSSAPEPAGHEEAPIDDGPPFHFLHDAEDERLAHLLQSERPQTVALVLSHLPSLRAGSVLAHFPPNLQVEIIRRLIDLEETDSAVLHEVERSLETRLSEQFAVQRRRVAGLEAVAAILDACDDHTSQRLLENLAACDRSLAERLGLQNIAFEDLADLNDDVLLTLLRTVDPALVRMALIGASPLLVERVLRTMSRHDARRLRKHLDNPGPLRLSDVDEARRQITAIVQRMLKTMANPASAA
jgi:flagellar motor switch protein FliG